MTNLQTIKATAELGILPEHRLRKMLKRGELPGIFHGNRFMVNIGLLEQLIESESRANVQGYDGAAD